MVELKKNRINLQNEIGGQVFFDEMLSNHTSFRIGGPANVLIIPKNIKDIEFILKLASNKKIPVCVIGNGTNLLVRDCGIRGIIIKISNTLDSMHVKERKIITGAGAPLAYVLKIATKHSLTGLEFTAGIHGTVGGAIAMNAGTHIGSISKVISEVTAMDLSGSLHVLSNEECGFGYRKSTFQEGHMIILQAEIVLTKGEKGKIEEKVSQIMKRRKKTQPLNKRSAGCIFRNPQGYSAGKLIEAVGLKGKRIGGAQISKIHPNFIINLKNAKASDVLALICLVQKEVAKKFGVFLDPEVRIIPKTNNAL